MLVTQPRLSNPRSERRGRKNFYDTVPQMHFSSPSKDAEGCHPHTHTLTTPPLAITPGNPHNYKLTTNHTATVLYHACLRTKKNTLHDDPRNKSDQVKSNRILRSTISLYLNTNFTGQGGEGGSIFIPFFILTKRMQPTNVLHRAIRRLQLTTKQVNGGYYKGTRSGAMGRHTKHGQYIIDWDKVRTYVVPDLTGFQVCSSLPSFLPSFLLGR